MRGMRLCIEPMPCQQCRLAVRPRSQLWVDNTLPHVTALSLKNPYNHASRRPGCYLHFAFHHIISMAYSLCIGSETHTPGCQDRSKFQHSICVRAGWEE